MLLWESLRARSLPRARHRTDRAALEQLEARELMAYSSLGYSLPDLRVSGLAAPVAAWGGTFDLTVILQNTGASTIIEPLSLVPSSDTSTDSNGGPVPSYRLPSSSDAPASQVDVYITPRPNSLAGAIKLGSVTAPALIQNDVERVDATFTLPTRPAGFAGGGGRFYVRLLANADKSIVESNPYNNLSKPLSVRVGARTLPSLTSVALDVPPTMQPGDTIQPVIRIANLGTATAGMQEPVEVALVASTTPDFNLGSSIVALYTLPGPLVGQSNTPVRGRVRSLRAVAAANVTPNRNVATITGTPVTLPNTPGTYYLGVVIDPNNKLQQSSIPGNRLQLIHRVGPPSSTLPPAGVVSSPLTQPFPLPPNGQAIGVL